MTLGFEVCTGDMHGQMETRFYGRIRPQRAVWLNHYGQQCHL